MATSKQLLQLVTKSGASLSKFQSVLRSDVAFSRRCRSLCTNSKDNRLNDVDIPYHQIPLLLEELKTANYKLQREYEMLKAAYDNLSRHQISLLQREKEILETTNYKLQLKKELLEAANHKLKLQNEKNTTVDNEMDSKSNGKEIHEQRSLSLDNLLGAANWLAIGGWLYHSIK